MLYGNDRQCRSSGFDSLDETIGEALAVCAEAVSTCIDLFAGGSAYVHVLETVYFTVIFILRSILKLADLARITANTHIFMVLQTLAYWIDAIIYRCLYALDECGRFDLDHLKANMAFRSLVYVCVSAISAIPMIYSSCNYRYGSTTPVPLSPSCLLYDQIHVVLDTNVLPRRYRRAAKLAKHNPILQGLIEVAEQRANRLLRSFDELEREVWGTTSQADFSTSQFKVDADPERISSGLENFGEERWCFWKRTLDQALKVQVPENCLTEEFREARRIGLDRDISDSHEFRWRTVMNDDRNWAHYQLRRGTRYKWGQYLRSNMDWNWDLGTCMKHLFKIWNLTQEGPAAHSISTSSPAVHLVVVPGESWSILAEEAHSALPKEVKIAYKTKVGKTQYSLFVPASPSPGHDRPIPETATSGPSVGEQEIDKMEDGDSSSGASKPGAHADRPVEALNDDVEGMETVCVVGVTEARKGGDAISICSLD